MVKRRDKTGRRQILQLEDKKPPQPVIVNKQPIRGIIHYSDSDDEAKKSPASSEPSVSSASEKTLKDPSIQIDTQVADFLKEIDALTVEENTEEKESSEAEPKENTLSSLNENSVPSPIAKESNDDTVTAVENGDTIVESNDVEASTTDATQGAYSIWQECHDESTGYSYYWNIQTNEVTWECPPEYATYLQFLHSADTAGMSSQTSSTVSEISTSKKRKVKKRGTPELEEGKIIPISYFGGSSSSSEDSSDESSASKTIAPSTIKKKNNHNLPPSSKAKHSEKDCSKSSLSKEIVEEIGPQLPPDFQFPDDIPVTPTPSSSSLDGVPYYDKDEEEDLVEIGPQLPSYYLPKETRITEVSPATVEQEVYKLDDSQLVSESTCIVESETNEDSSQDPSQSTINDTKFPIIEHEDDSWEESLSKLNKEFEDQYRKKELNIDEEPDSTTKKDLSLAKTTDVDSSHLNDTPHVFKAVVEYDSDTEEENSRIDSISNSPNHVKTEVKSDFIDSMFLAHGTGKKFGFGFSKSRQLELENGSFDGGGGKSRGVKRKASSKDSDYPMISFVKSKEILNLNVLNKCDDPEDICLESKSNVISEKETQSSVSVDPDLDEIDKALDKALEKKEEVENSELPNNVEDSLLPSKDITDIPLSEEVESSTLSKPATKSKKHSVLNDDEKPSGSQKKIKKEEPEQTSLTSTDMLGTILELSSLLVDKLTFLLASHSTMSSLTSLLIQIQTRHIDWQEGALDSKYFMDRLQEVHQYLRHYEMGAVSGGWTCQWDSEHKRYFYVNERTQQSQWNFPAECSMQVALQTKQMWASHVSDISVASSTSFQTSGAQFPLVSSSMSEERSQSNLPSTSGVFIVKHKTDQDLLDEYPAPSASWVCSALLPQPSPPPPPPGVDSPPPPPPKTPPPKSPPPPPPDSTELEEGEIPDVDMEIDDSNSFESGTCVRKVSQSSKSTSSQHSSSASPKHNLECSSTRSPDHPLKISTSMVSSTSANSSEQIPIIAKPPQPVTASSSMEPIQVSSDNTFTAIWAHTLPSCSSTQNGAFNSVPVNTDITSLAPPGTLPLAITEGMGTRDAFQSASTSDCSENSHAPVPTPAPIQAPAPKKEKRKSKLLPGLALKKKNIPSLVQKWQKIKKQQEKEDKNSDEARISTSM